MRGFILCLLTYFAVIYCAKADRIIIKGDTTNFWPEKSALEQHPDIKNIRKFLAGYQTDPCFDCGMVDYVAEWTITGNSLYLTGIYPDNSKKRGEKADLNKIFKVSNSRIKADWVNADFWLPIGKPLRWADIMTPVYSAELLLVIKKGQIAKQQQFKYPTTRRLQDLEIPTFIYAKIDWNKIPYLPQQTKVFLSFAAGVTGKPEKADIARGTECAPCNKEALRALSLMPWPADYKHGKLLRYMYYQPLIFSEEQRIKYAY